MINLSPNLLSRATLFIRRISFKCSDEGGVTASGSNATSSPIMQSSLEIPNVSIDPTCNSGRTCAADGRLICMCVCSVGGRCLCSALVVSPHAAVPFSSYWNSATWRLGMPRSKIPHGAVEVAVSSLEIGLNIEHLVLILCWCDLWLLYTVVSHKWIQQFSPVLENKEYITELKYSEFLDNCSDLDSADLTVDCVLHCHCGGKSLHVRYLVSCREQVGYFLIGHIDHCWQQDVCWLAAGSNRMCTDLQLTTVGNR